jgi:hypothetical protein
MNAAGLSQANELVNIMPLVRPIISRGEFQAYPGVVRINQIRLVADRSGVFA